MTPLLELDFAKAGLCIAKLDVKIKAVIKAHFNVVFFMGLPPLAFPKLWQRSVKKIQLKNLKLVKCGD